MASPQLHQIRCLLRCGVCKEEETNHKQLPCQHTVCKECMVELVGEERNSFKCPVCSQECLVPNGGVTEFPDSLFTKQMADILKSFTKTELKEATADCVKSGRTDEQVRVLLDNPAKRVQLGKELEKHSTTAHSWLEKTRQKVAMVTQDLNKLPSNCQSAKKELQIARDRLKVEFQKKIKDVDEFTKARISDIHQQRGDREEEIGSWMRKTKPKLCQVQDVMKDAEMVLRGISNKNGNAARLQKALQKVDFLKSFDLPSDDLEWDEFHIGDSCRLKVSPEDVMNVDAKLGFSKIGRVLKFVQLLDEVRIKIVFPGEGQRHSFLGITGLELVTKSLTPSPVPMFDTKVRFRKPSQEKPGSSTSEKMMDTQRQLYNDKVEGWIYRLHSVVAEDSEVVVTVNVEFPGRVCWSGLIDNLEKVEGPLYQPGDKVWMGRGVTKPSLRFNGVTRSSCGVVSTISGPFDDEVVVDFPEYSSWKGRTSEVRGCITPFEQTAVQISLQTNVGDPRKWKGITHEEIGILQSIRDGFNNKGEQTRLASVQFTDKIVECELLELELAMTSDASQFVNKMKKKYAELNKDERASRGFEVELFLQNVTTLTEDEIDIVALA